MNQEKRQWRKNKNRERSSEEGRQGGERREGMATVPGDFNFHVAKCHPAVNHDTSPHHLLWPLGGTSGRKNVGLTPSRAARSAYCCWATREGRASKSCQSSPLSKGNGWFPQPPERERCPQLPSWTVLTSGPQGPGARQKLPWVGRDTRDSVKKAVRNPEVTGPVSVSNGLTLPAPRAKDRP